MITLKGMFAVGLCSSGSSVFHDVAGCIAQFRHS